MKLEILGLVHNVGGIKPTKNGFQQVVILHQPEVKDDLDRVSRREEFFQVTVWSKEQTDSRFLQPKHMRAKMKAIVYLKGERWFNEKFNDFNYAHKLNLNEWGK
jgi:hypothetical protein